MLTQTDLQQFTGSKHRYKYSVGISYTDGMAFLAKKAKAFWLLDAIASHRRPEPFQIWFFRRGRPNVLSMAEDAGQPELVRQEIRCSDFPLEEIKLYLVDGVLMLPSEY